MLAEVNVYGPPVMRDVQIQAGSQRVEKLCKSHNDARIVVSVRLDVFRLSRGVERCFLVLLSVVVSLLGRTEAVLPSLQLTTFRDPSQQGRLAPQRPAKEPFSQALLYRVASR